MAGIICVVLVVFGFGAFNLFGVTEPKVAVVNGEDITVQSLSNRVQQRRRELTEMYQGQIDQQQLNSFINESSELELLIDQTLLRQHANDNGIVSSNLDFSRTIQEFTEFQEDGKFSEGKYRDFVRGLGISPQTYEQYIKEDKSRQQLIDAYQMSAFFLPQEVEDRALIDSQKRNVAYLEFRTDDYLDQVEVSDDQIESFYTLNQDEYRSEELFTFQTIEINLSDFTEGLEVDEDELLNRYASTIEAEQADAERRGSHILLELTDISTTEAIDQLNEFKRQLMDGEATFAELAEAHSADPGSAANGGDLGFAAKGAYVPEFEEALWGLNEVGDYSEPVVTQFGVHLIRLEEIQEVEVLPFEDRKEELSSLIRSETARKPYEEAIAELDRLTFEISDSLEPAAEQLGLEIKEFADIGRSNNNDIFVYPSVKDAFFDLDVTRSGFNSAVVSILDDRSIVGRVVSSVPAEQLLLEDVRERIIGQLKTQEAAKLLDDSVASAENELNDDVDLDAFAESLGKEWTKVDGASVDEPALPSIISDEAFTTQLTGAENRATIVLESPWGDAYYIAVVTGFQEGEPESVTEEERETIESALSNERTHIELQLLLASLRSEASLSYEINPADLVSQ